MTAIFAECDQVPAVFFGGCDIAIASGVIYSLFFQPGDGERIKAPYHILVYFRKYERHTSAAMRWKM